MNFVRNGMVTDSPTIKKCGCGREYTVDSWGWLEAIGVQVTDDGERTYKTEMRDCLCGSTIAIETSEAMERPWVEETPDFVPCLYSNDGLFCCGKRMGHSGGHDYTVELGPGVTT